ncbi:hypothetical protein [Aureispira anguillae]|nr:hypothetical protein [Aureispira anguillae]
MKRTLPLYLFFFVFSFLCFIPSTATYAKAVFIAKDSSSKTIKKHSHKYKGKRKRMSMHRKGIHKQNQAQKSKPPFLLLFLLIWYPIFIGLLIIALIFSIQSLLIISIIFLLLPIFIAIVIALIFIIGLATWSGSLC